MADARKLLETFVPYPNDRGEDVRRFIAEGVRPEVKGGRVSLDPSGNLVARLGPEPGPESPPFYVCAYGQDFGPGGQEDPYIPKIVDGAPHGQEGECLWGRGNCEHRGALAAALAAYNRLAGAEAGWRRPLVLLVLTTGESGHHRTLEGALADNGLPAGDAVIARGTGNRVCLGNKGSLHLTVEIRGRSYHPSNPARALNAIDGAEQALGKLRAYAAAHPVRDPDLGDSVLVPVDIESSPRGPIIPDLCRIAVSGRLVPGQDPEELAAGLRAAVSLSGGFDTEVRLDRYHHPAKVPADHPLAAAAADAVRGVGGDAAPLYMHASLDAGYFGRLGRAALSLGPGAPELAHSPVDLVSLKELADGEEIYLSLFRKVLAR